MPFKRLDEYFKQTSIDERTKTTIQIPMQQKFRIAGFYKETQYQDTKIGKIPKEWQVVKLKEVANINEKPGDTENAMRIVARIPMELIPEEGIYAKYELADFKEVKSYVKVKAGDILLAKITPSFENGKQGIVPADVPDGVAFATTEVYAKITIW